MDTSLPTPRKDAAQKEPASRALDSTPGWIAPLLGAVAGFVDTTGFVAFAGVFVAHVTGNFVVLGATLSGEAHGSVVAKLAVLPLFVVGVVFGAYVLRANASKGPSRLAASQAALLVACGVLGLLLRSPTLHVSGLEPLAIACGVLAMGLQAMLARTLKLPMTHVMTGNVTQLTVDLMEMNAGRAGAASSARRNIVLVAAFAVGAALAGLLVPRFGAGAVLLPAAACGVLAFRLRP